MPDHSTFSKNRHGRFRESDLFRRVFETVLRRCIRERLVGGEGFAVDASLIKADANRQKGIEGEKGLPPEATSRAIDEYLAVLDDAAFGAATEVTPKFVSPADPAARWTGAHGGQAFFAYSTNYLIDVEHAVIVDVEATTAIRQAEVLAARRMIERSMDRFDLYPARLMGDSAYGSAEMLGWLVHEHGIEPHVTVFDKSARKDGTFSRDDFTYDHQHDVYRCPGGTALRTTGTLVNDGATMLYSALQRECAWMRPQAQVLPEHAGAQDPALDPRRCARHGPADRQVMGRGHLSTAAQEGRDAVRSPQTHPQARSAATERTDRRSRRVPARSHRPEPQEAGEAGPAPEPQASLRSRQDDCDARRQNDMRPIYCALLTDLFNRIGPMLTQAAAGSRPAAGPNGSEVFVQSGGR